MEQFLRFLCTTLYDLSIICLCSFFALIDMTTVIPIWLSYFLIDEPIDYQDINTPYEAFNFCIGGAHTLRILRALRVLRSLTRIENEVNRFVCELSVSVLTMILFGMCFAFSQAYFAPISYLSFDFVFVQTDSAVLVYLERHLQAMNFHTWVYGIVVTITTVGYGEKHHPRVDSI
jgi:hypothetical protein